MVAWPDGSLADYLRSLHDLRDLTAEHGLSYAPPVTDRPPPSPLTLLDEYLQHRHERLGPSARRSRPGLLRSPMGGHGLRTAAPGVYPAVRQRGRPAGST